MFKQQHSIQSVVILAFLIAIAILASEQGVEAGRVIQYTLYKTADCRAGSEDWLKIICSADGIKTFSSDGYVSTSYSSKVHKLNECQYNGGYESFKLAVLCDVPTMQGIFIGNMTNCNSGCVSIRSSFPDTFERPCDPKNPLAGFITYNVAAFKANLTEHPMLKSYSCENPTVVTGAGNSSINTMNLVTMLIAVMSVVLGLVL